MSWSEGKIARMLARNTFSADLCVLPNCNWTGYEIDLLVVTPNRRIIDVEIKISRADLKADAKKDKWWYHPPRVWNPDPQRYVKPEAQPKAWPTMTWKHYYAMPKDIWREDFLSLVQPISGVLLVSESKSYANGLVECVKRAKPCATAPQMNEDQIVRIARLTSLRMWDAYKAMEQRQ